ncbi:MAG: hypothetical protein ABI822_28185 [Bryobacteraceae bacterium]
MRKRWIIAGAVSALMSGAAFAQERRELVFTQALPAPSAGAAGDVMFFNGGTTAGATVQFLSTEMSFEGGLVKGAPYSAEAVTETTQLLGDGNRITRKTTASLYRDSEGRTRREQSLPAIGPWATSGTPPVNVFINDPVSGVNYILDSNSKTARKVVPGKFTRVADGRGVAGVAGVAAAGMTFSKGEMVHSVTSQASVAPQVKDEKLPSRLIEGVQAEGSRTTFTIPAGEVGNERPIDVVSERWYSPELKTVIMSSNNDPRMGETVYSLKGLQRAEPSRSLFEVPADYTISDDSNPETMRQHKLMMEKMVERKPQ